MLAYGLDDDAKLDRAGLYLQALRTLEAPHVRVLDLFVRAREAREPTGWSGARASRLRSAFPGLADGLEAIVPVLVREGLAVQSIIDGGDAAGNVDHGWSVTDFGVSVHTWLAPAKRPPRTHA